MSNKNWIYLIIVGLIVILIIFIITSLSGKKQTTLQITSDPENIDVVIDNQRYQSPVTIPLAPATYTIWGFKEGYNYYKKDIQVKKGKENTLKITLEKLNPALEPPEGAP